MPRTKGAPNKKRKYGHLGILSSPITFRLPQPVFEDFEAIIKSEGVRRSEFIEDLMVQYIMERKGKIG